MHQWCEFGDESIFLALFPGRTLKNTTHTPPGNPVEFNQSDDDFDTPEVFPDKCAISDV